MDADRFAFRLAFDNLQAGITQNYQLLYYVRRDGFDELELIDVRCYSAQRDHALFINDRSSKAAKSSLHAPGIHPLSSVIYTLVQN
jgi:hypothetical protein